jgi:hypothetical protein
MPKGTTTCNKLLSIMYLAVGWANVADNAASAPLTNVYARLATASYGPSSVANANEVAYTNYAGGIAVPRSAAGWSTPSGGQISNVNPIEYLQCGVTGANATSACTTTAATGATDIWHYGDLNSPIAISNQIQPRFPAGAMTITEA